jgi:AraC-like DNA-binding protein
MSYISTRLKQEFCVDRIITIHYFEYMENFSFRGESHNFWEFLCVDRGEVEVQADEKIFTLKKNDVIFHKPMEFHAIRSCSNTAPNLVVISFESQSRAMQLFQNKVLSSTDRDRLLLSKIIAEARVAFSTPLHIPSVEQVQHSPNAPFGSEQLIKLYLEQLLIGFIREENSTRIRNSTPYTWRKSQEKTLEKVLQYMELHISEHLTVQIICNENLVGRSYLQELFHREMKCGVMEYFNRMKIELAKQIIRDENKNFSEIADYLSYSASPYFSKKFKQITGMSPSEYALSIKGLSDEVSTAVPCKKAVAMI